MGLVNRLKRWVPLWSYDDVAKEETPIGTRELTGEEAIVKAVFGENTTIIPKRMATIVQDDPLDIFPSDNADENDKTSQ